MSKLVTVVVTAELPKHVKPKDFHEYVLEEVKATLGGLNPADPVFFLDKEKVNVTRLKSNKLVKNLIKQCEFLGSTSIGQECEDAIKAIQEAP